MNYPFKSAQHVAKEMRKLRKDLAETCHSEINHKAESQRLELIKVLDMEGFDRIIKQLELLYDNKYLSY